MINKRFTSYILGFSMLALAGSLVAEETLPPPPREVQVKHLHLAYHDQTFQGQNTLYLRQKVAQQHPHLSYRLDDFVLKRADLIAKLQHGQGAAHLVVGPFVSHPYSYSPSNAFSTVSLNYPQDTSLGHWQIKLSGTFTVRAVVLHLHPRIPVHKAPPAPSGPAFCAICGKITGQWHLVKGVALFTPDNHLVLQTAVNQGQYCFPNVTDGPYFVLPLGGGKAGLNVQPPRRNLFCQGFQKYMNTDFHVLGLGWE